MAVTVGDFKSIIAERKAAGQSMDEIFGALLLMYKDGAISLEDLDQVVNSEGYRLSDEFKNMSEEQRKSADAGFEKINEEAPDGMSKDGKEVNDPAKVESEAKSAEEKPVEDKPAEDDSEEKKPDDESEEKKKAWELFGEK